MRVSIFGLVNKRNILYRFKKYLKISVPGMEFYKNLISKYINISISTLTRFGMVLFVWRLYYSDDILLIDIQTNSLYHFPIKNSAERIYQIYRFFDSKYPICFEIPTPASPSLYTFTSRLLFYILMERIFLQLLVQSL